jgi:hypothetical protein
VRCCRRHLHTSHLPFPSLIRTVVVGNDTQQQQRCVLQ